MVYITLDNYKGSKIYYRDGYRFLYRPSSGEINAGKYYYLKILSLFHAKPNLVNESMKLITWIYNNTTREYNPEVWKHIVSSCSGILNNGETFFFIIYLAMLDLEVGSMYPFGSGKDMVYKSCKAVLVDGKDYNTAAVMFSKKSISTNACQNDDDEEDYNEWDEYGRSGEKYGWYNGYSDDVIDDAFDGCPEATWNVD